MTIIAGVYAWGDSGADIRDIKRQVRSLISRDPLDVPQERTGSRFYFVKVDIGAFGVPAVMDSEDTGVAFMAGDPILPHPETGKVMSRDSALESLFREWMEKNSSGLVRCRGHSVPHM